MSEWRSCYNFLRWCRVIRRTSTSKLTNKGFSLLETVVVLALLMAGIGLVLPAILNKSVQIEEEHFFQLLKNDIYFAQSEAYRTKSAVSVIFNPNEGRYDIVQNLFAVISTRQMPDTVSFDPASNLTEISYWSTGSVLASGTLRFNTSTGVKTIVVYLGKGRVFFSG